MVATSQRRIVVAVVAALALIAGIAAALTARPAGDGSPRAGSGATAGSPPANGTEPPVIVPGRPGEPALVTPGGQVERPAGRHNSMDVWFVRMMIPHHTQALQMAALAPQRTSHAGVRALADRVRASQVPEIQLLRGWLEARHLGPDDPRGGHDHETMPGMQSGSAMRQLADARGSAFDRLFVEMMTAHHRGAITMATELLRVGIDTTVHEFATSVAVEQGVEIDRMRDLLR